MSDPHGVRPRSRSLFVLLTVVATMAGVGCTKNNMAYQASIRPWQSAEQPAEGSVPMTGIEPKLEDGEAIDALANPVAADAASIQRGLALFADHCVACHGPGGDGHGVLEKELDQLIPLGEMVTPDITDGYVYTVIRDGGVSMPPYGPDLAIQERWDLVNYLRTLAEQDDE